MDVPSWHPANQNSDALRRLAVSGGASSKRVELTVMAGSNVDTSTKAERLLVAKEETVMRLGGGRGLLDPSDRLYLEEQIELEQAAKGREQLEREAALQTFRSNALKAHKTTEIQLVAVASAKSKLLPPEKKPLVVIKAKKRATTATEKDAKAKKAKTTMKNGPGNPDKTDKGGRTPAMVVKRGKGDRECDATSTTKPATKTPVSAALLLQDYSSSSDDE
ncbi:hypothetical protein PF005_g4741 [Phytophthora fragariae]|uniref:Uncharacterized protein n=1 Tax=Phytophthora fragariae TaxID=53985 RepID=A0A6A3FJC9_9STRA|nr:hypothetical protein PF003_g217 [Phytophthora fragariae]KAE8945263.1 hypothetical protein PF009_g5090 [Phytophthora fragariae]KAE9024514.1 hypothetical protein PF011_g3476 [Phytophthora fragariae]KAE9129743.1 hypothetical protein PF007_g4778 [Phytophthora fragariae]KAE9129952.1 hypothetical protein PF010_g4012 [Phytophthora fragariae]